MIHSALEVKAALVEVAQEAVKPDGDHSLLVLSGNPGQQYADDIVSAGRYGWSEEPGPMSTQRRRNLDVRVAFTIMAFRAPVGDEDAEAVAEARCLEIADALGDYLRETDPTLGGRAMWCFRTSYESEGMTADDAVAGGRVMVATVEFTARCRIG